MVEPSSSATRSAIVRGRDPPRLGVADQAVDATAELQAQLRELRALARPGLAGDDDDLVVADRRQQLVAPRR